MLEWEKNWLLYSIINTTLLTVPSSISSTMPILTYLVSITIFLVKYYPNVIDNWMKYNEVKYCVKAPTISNGTGFELHQSGSSKSTHNYCTRIYHAELHCLLLVCFLEKIFWNNNSRNGSRVLRKGQMNPLSTVLHICGKNRMTVLIIIQCK